MESWQILKRFEDHHEGRFGGGHAVTSPGARFLAVAACAALMASLAVVAARARARADGTHRHERLHQCASDTGRQEGLNHGSARVVQGGYESLSSKTMEDQEMFSFSGAPIAGCTK